MLVSSLNVACMEQGERKATNPGPAPLLFASEQSLSYLDGTLPADYGCGICTAFLCSQAPSTLRLSRLLFRVLLLSTLVCRFDPLGLMDPEGQGGFINQAWLKYSEVIHARWAMLGAAGALIAQH